MAKGSISNFSGMGTFRGMAKFRLIRKLRGNLKFCGFGKVNSKGKNSGKEKVSGERRRKGKGKKFSQLLVRGQPFFCGGKNCRFPRWIRRFFQIRCIPCAEKFRTRALKAKHLDARHKDWKVCKTCFQGFTESTNISCGHWFVLPETFVLVPKE